MAACFLLREFVTRMLMLANDTEGLLTGFGVDCAEQDRVESEVSSSVHKSDEYKAEISLTLPERHAIQWSSDFSEGKQRRDSYIETLPLR